MWLKAPEKRKKISKVKNELSTSISQTLLEKETTLYRQDILCPDRNNTYSYCCNHDVTHQTNTVYNTSISYSLSLSAAVRFLLVSPTLTGTNSHISFFKSTHALWIVKQLFTTVHLCHAEPQGRKLLDIKLYNRICVGREDLHGAAGSEYSFVKKKKRIVSSVCINRKNRSIEAVEGNIEKNTIEFCHILLFLFPSSFLCAAFLLKRKWGVVGQWALRDWKRWTWRQRGAALCIQLLWDVSRRGELRFSQDSSLMQLRYSAYTHTHAHALGVHP